MTSATDAIDDALDAALLAALTAELTPAGPAALALALLSDREFRARILRAVIRPDVRVSANQVLVVDERE